jgi:plastocyanin
MKHPFRPPAATRLLCIVVPALLLMGAATEVRSGTHASGAGGTVSGIVEISAALASRRPQFRIYADARPGSVAPRIPDNELRSELRNVVVYLQADRGTPLPAPDHVEGGVMSQMKERFDPHVLPVLQGARVDFPNYDDIYHNVFSLSRARTFDLGRYPKNASKSVHFPTPGIVQVFCHIHADMSAVVLVLPNRYFATPDSSGRYVIPDIPPGDYTVVGWHERTRPVTHHVRVAAGREATVHFRLPLGTSDTP